MGLIALVRAACAAGADRRRAATIRASRPTRTTACDDVDFVVRGEGEQTFRELLRALEASRRLRRDPRPVVPGAGGAGSATRRRPVVRLASEPIWPARTAARACSTATRCSAGQSTSSRPRAAARSTAASARSSRCAAATSTRTRSSACSPTSRTRARTARARSSSSTTTSRSTSSASRRCATRSSTAASTTSSTSCRR